MFSSDSEKESFSYLVTEYEQVSSENELSFSDESSDSDDGSIDLQNTPSTQLSFDLPNLEINQLETPVEGSMKRNSTAICASAKRLRVWSYRASKSTKASIQIKYIGESHKLSINLPILPGYNISVDPPKYFSPSKDWGKRTISNWIDN